MPLTLSGYFGRRFATAALGVFMGMFVLVALIDYVEMMRRTSGIPNLSTTVVAAASFLRVPQTTERLMSFAVLVGAMSCYLNLSRRLELVIARSAGISAWQFVAPAVVVALIFGILATTVYNPLAASFRDRSKRIEAEIFGQPAARTLDTSGNFWIRQRSAEGDAIINATSSRDQGVRLGGVSVFTFAPGGQFQVRIEAKTASLVAGHWQLDEARVHVPGKPSQEQQTYLLPTELTPDQLLESFSTPDTVPFWRLPVYIDMAERAGLSAAGYRLQFNNLLARPALLAAMVLLASAVSLRFFRFGGVQKMVLSGVAAGFLLYVLSKVTEDLSKAELMHPVAAAWCPVLVGALVGVLVLLHQEDG